MNIIDARVRLPQEFRSQKEYSAPSLQTEQYDRVLGLSEKVNAGTLKDLMRSLASHGVKHAVMHAETEGGEDVNELNDAVAGVVDSHPDMFKGIGAVDIYTSSPGEVARQVVEVSDRGLVGVSVQPAFAGMDIDEKFLYPLYSRAEELGLVVCVHTGITYSRIHPIRHERAELLDQVACDFPNLRLIACHAGWPYVAEYCAVARRHPTVYLEFGGLAPKYVAKAGSGWETMFALMPNLLRGQVLYGSDWPVMDPARAVPEWLESGLDEVTLSSLLWSNAAKLFDFHDR